MGMGIASECTTVSVWGSLGRVRSKCIQVVPAPFYQPKDKSLFHFYNEDNYYVSSPNAIQVVMAVYYLLHNIAFIAWVIHHNNIQVIKGV